jgi:hypothetical protein
MDTLFAIGWFLWAPLCAWFSRSLIVRLLRPRMGYAAYGVAYAFWVVSLIAGLTFVQWTGMQFYGFDRTDPWQLAGWIILFLSPFGLPLLFGGPVVLVADAARLALPARRKAGS